MENTLSISIDGEYLYDSKPNPKSIITSSKYEYRIGQTPEGIFLIFFRPLTSSTGAWTSFSTIFTAFEEAMKHVRSQVVIDGPKITTAIRFIEIADDEEPHWPFKKIMIDYRFLAGIPVGQTDDYIAKVLRLAFNKWSGRKRFLSSKGGWCERCGKGGNIKDRVAHHIVPIKHYTSYPSWKEYIDAIYTTQLMSLCPSCHGKIHAELKKQI